jgi:hypothetical protein
MLMLERIDATKRLWQIAIPQCPAPPEAQLLRWLDDFEDDEMEHAIRRTSKKFRTVPIELLVPDRVYRYVTGVLVNERNGVTPGGR